MNQFQHNFFVIADAQKYNCPNDKYGVYPDPVQCDKFYECADGVSTVKLCPDGLVFDETIRKENKCDQPFNVECGDRTEMRKSITYPQIAMHNP